MVFSSTFETDFEEKPSLLGNLFFGSICDRHPESLKGR
jgi:hypothetical protein